MEGDFSALVVMCFLVVYSSAEKCEISPSDSNSDNKQFKRDTFRISPSRTIQFLRKARETANGGTLSESAFLKALRRAQFERTLAETVVIDEAKRAEKARNLAPITKPKSYFEYEAIRVGRLARNETTAADRPTLPERPALSAQQAMPDEPEGLGPKPVGNDKWRPGLNNKEQNVRVRRQHITIKKRGKTTQYTPEPSTIQRKVTPPFLEIDYFQAQEEEAELKFSTIVGECIFQGRLVKNGEEDKLPNGGRGCFCYFGVVYC